LLGIANRKFVKKDLEDDGMNRTDVTIPKPADDTREGSHIDNKPQPDSTTSRSRTPRALL